MSASNGRLTRQLDRAARWMLSHRMAVVAATVILVAVSWLYARRRAAR